MSCHKIDGEKCKKVIDGMMVLSKPGSKKNKLRIMEVEEAETDGCCGYKSPAECPHNGVFDKGSPACKECAEDAIIGYDTSDIL